MDPIPPASVREHLFISYAVKDVTFAMWLARKLAAEGYRVWMDKLRLLGGQDWPKEINEAINARSFLMLALMSTASVKRENPRGEWTLGLNVAKILGRDFVVPIMVDRFDAKDLGFLHINRQYIDFKTSWAEGFRDLLKTLHALNVPTAASDGKSISASSFMPERLVVSKRERLISNIVRFKRIPSGVLQFASSRKLTDAEWTNLKQAWAFRPLKGGSFLAIAPPPKPYSGDVFKTEPSKLTWDQVKAIHGIDTVAFVSEMIRKATTALLVGRGFALDDDDRSVYLDSGDPEKNRVVYHRLDGRRSWVAASGKRTFRVGKDVRRAVFYRLGFRITIEESPIHGWVLIPKLFLRLRGENDVKLTDASAMSRRRTITRDWWNDKQLATHLAFLAVVAIGQSALENAGADCGISLDTTPVEFTVERGIDETRLAPGADLEQEPDDKEIEDLDGEADSVDEAVEK